MVPSNLDSYRSIIVPCKSYAMFVLLPENTKQWEVGGWGTLAGISFQETKEARSVGTWWQYNSETSTRSSLGNAWLPHEQKGEAKTRMKA